MGSHLLRKAGTAAVSVVGVATVGVRLWGQLTMFEGMDHELMLFVNTLGVSIMVLVVLYHALVARQRDTG